MHRCIFLFVPFGVGQVSLPQAGLEHVSSCPALLKGGIVGMCSCPVFHRYVLSISVTSNRQDRTMCMGMWSEGLHLESFVAF